ncbi:MAG: SEL1-like repeat protein [Epsilonproteobacteria bacterium]|nr:SEL1-like repeat protein [Campylobacterota bacterium]
MRKIFLFLVFLSFVIGGGINIDELKNRAKSGDSEAMYQLGYIYENGNGVVTPDINLSLYYYSEAAKRGNKDAALALELLKELNNKEKPTFHSTKIYIEQKRNILKELKSNRD